jgi:hypothetical protein
MVNATTYVVHPDGTGDFPTIQDAILAATDGDVIELTDGTFRSDGNRDIDYLGKAITVRSQSGNPEACIIDCEGWEAAMYRGFLFQSGEQAGSVLHGVTITNGWALPDPDAGGGAILCTSGSSPTIETCIFLQNRFSAVYCIDESSPGFTDCLFLQNEGREGGAVRAEVSSPTFNRCDFIGNTAELAAGAYAAHVSGPTFTSCTFTENSTDGTGGAVNIWCGGEPVLLDCLFQENSADEAGAMMLFCFILGTIEGCTFVGNSAVAFGGALATGKMSDVAVTRCTFYGNSAAWGGVFAGGEIEVDFDNCILAFSTDGEAITCETTQMNLTCCDLYGNADGDWVGCIADQYGVNGNISEDPLFCNPENGDLTLQSDSPCAAENNPVCGQIGAWPIGCDPPVPVGMTSWGRLRRLYR